MSNRVFLKIKNRLVDENKVESIIVNKAYTHAYKDIDSIEKVEVSFVLDDYIDTIGGKQKMILTEEFNKSEFVQVKHILCQMCNISNTEVSDKLFKNLVSSAPIEIIDE